MYISLIRYKNKKTGKKYRFLAFVIGDSEDKIYCLKSSYLNDLDVLLLKNNIDNLKKLSPEKVIEWCKKHIAGYKKAYRGISKKNCLVEKRYK